MNSDKLILSKENGIATLTLNRPEKLNAMTDEMWQQLPRLIDEANDDNSVKVLVVTGTERAFCVGSDVGGLASRAGGKKGPSKSRKEITTPTGSETLRLAKLEKPTIAAINGIAAGAGISIALACDIRIASEQARFVAAWVNRGMVPDGGASYYLTQILGPSKALEIVFTGASIDAAEAERLGIVSRVVPDDSLTKVVQELAEKIARGPSVAIELMKKCVYRALTHDLESQLYFESYAQDICRRTEDHKEGNEAFKQKRQPKFKGK